MRAFFDTEYIIKGKRPIFASIGIVRDDGQELHLVSRDFDPDKGGWYFKKKVWKHMSGLPRAPLAEIATAVIDFLKDVTLVAVREGGLDRKVLEGLIGPLTINYCDIQKLWQSVGQPELPERLVKKHHALEDAHWHRTLFYHLIQPLTLAA